MPSREKCWERTGGGIGGGGCQAEDEPRIKHAWSKAGSWEAGRGRAASRCSKPGVFFLVFFFQPKSNRCGSKRECGTSRGNGLMGGFKVTQCKQMSPESCVVLR